MDNNLKNIRIAFLVYSRLYDLLSKPSFKNRIANIRIIKSYFNDTIISIKQLVDTDSIDVVIAGGSNARIIKENFPQLPIITLKVTGFDLLSAFIKAKSIGRSTAIVTYKSGAQWADKIKLFSGSLNVDITNLHYYEINDLDEIMQLLVDNNVESVIGASVVCDYAERFGIQPILVYSEGSIIESLEQAENLQESIRREKETNNYLRTIIDFTYSGIIAIDQNKNITICNPTAEKILGINKTNLINRKINEVLPSTRLDKILETGLTETNKIQLINDETTISTNRIPIIVDDVIVGAVATFNDVVEIQKIEQNIRKKIHSQSKGFISKYNFDDIKGTSETILQAKHLTEIYAKSNQTLLIQGETGTGKELFAHSIHYYSNRHDKPFVALNCATLPANLLESELFGYEGGAFTGAKKEGKPGLFELAHLGTIFLDEISEMPLLLQARLLRVLQEKEILRVGGGKIIPVDVRIIATTNEDLREKVEKKEFREDLYYRLNILYLAVPPLRDHMEDISVLVKNIVYKTSSELYDNHKSIWNNIIKTLIKYDWPGNIRQLENAVHRLCVIIDANNEKIIPTNILEKAIGLELAFSRDSKLKNPERVELINIMESTHWNRKKAAELLGVSRTTLWRKIKKHNLDYYQ